MAARNDKMNEPPRPPRPSGVEIVCDRNHLGLKYDQKGIWPLIGRPDLVASTWPYSLNVDQSSPDLRPPRPRRAADDAIFGRGGITPFDRVEGWAAAARSLLCRVPFAPSCFVLLLRAETPSNLMAEGTQTHTTFEDAHQFFSINGLKHSCYISIGAAGTDTPPSCKQQSSASSYL